jgi:hypothetical protein
MIYSMARLNDGYVRFSEARGYNNGWKQCSVPQDIQNRVMDISAGYFQCGYIGRWNGQI